jgi:hypothetical protein
LFAPQMFTVLEEPVTTLVHEPIRGGWIPRT